MKEKKEEKKIEERLEELDLEKILEKKAKKKRLLIGLIVTIVIIAFSAFVTYNHFYGNKGYIKADIKVSSSSKLYSNSEPENAEDIGEGALFILYIEGIKRDDFLAEYEVTEITINGEKTDIEILTYRHLNNALSIRMHSVNYNLEEGNSIIISLKEKSTGQIITRRLYHKTEVL